MANPLIDQGVLNRLIASVTYATFPQLNVTASFLGDTGIRVALTGKAATRINTLTGQTVSLEPFIPAVIQIPLLKTQNLSNVYKLQMELLARVGAVNVYPDVSAGGIGIYAFVNASIGDVGEMDMGGRNPVWGVSVEATYNVNSAAWDG